MKIGKLDPEAVRSTDSSARVTVLSEDDLKHVSGAGCRFNVVDEDGNHVGTGHHPSYPVNG